ncbi:uncharacterized protein V6R79_011959 [Siganus canaliculatus]
MTDRDRVPPWTRGQTGDRVPPWTRGQTGTGFLPGPEDRPGPGSSLDQRTDRDRVPPWTRGQTGTGFLPGPEDSLEGPGSFLDQRTDEDQSTECEQIVLNIVLYHMFSLYVNGFYGSFAFTSWLSCCGAARRPCVQLHLSCSAQSSTAGNMRSFILVAVLLQLAAIITHTTAQYDFGDIIAFPRECNEKNIPEYIHFGIFVPNNLIFHLTQDDNGNAICDFDHLQDVQDHIMEQRFNYLDNDNTYRAQATQQLIDQRIADVPHDCGKYSLLNNNCEHMATFLRYNQKVCLQRGAKYEALLAMAAPPQRALWHAVGRVRCVPRQA